MRMGRREFLKTSAALAAASAANLSCIEIASAAPIEVLTVDKLAIRVLVDSSYDLFFRPAETNGVKISPPPRLPDYPVPCITSGGYRCGSSRNVDPRSAQ